MNKTNISFPRGYQQYVHLTNITFLLYLASFLFTHFFFLIITTNISRLFFVGKTRARSVLCVNTAKLRSVCLQEIQTKTITYKLLSYHSELK